MIKEQSLDSLERSTEVNLTQKAGARCSGCFCIMAEMSYIDRTD